MRRLFPIVAAAIVSACTAGRNYSRPAVNVPEEFRGRAPEPGAGPSSIADAPWWDLFQDEQLQALIHTALDRNYDLRIAAARILQAEAQFGITRADEFPTVTAGATVADQKSSASPTRSVIGGLVVQGSAAWQLDFWGRYRRASESARAQLLATEWGRRAIVTTLVSEVVSVYEDVAEDKEIEVRSEIEPDLRVTGVQMQSPTSFSGS